MQNIINNNYNINNVTNTLVPTMNQNAGNLSSCPTEQTITSFQEPTPSASGKKEKPKKPQTLEKIINGEANKTMNIMIKTFDTFERSDLANESEATRITGEGLYHVSRLQKEHKPENPSNFMDASHPDDSFGNFGKHPKKPSLKMKPISPKDSELGITFRLNQIEQQMGETDFKGRPILGESEQPSEQSVEEEKPGEQDENPFLNVRSPSPSNQMKSIRSIRDFNPNYLTRTTCIQLPLPGELLTPKRSTVSINPAILKLKSQILTEAGKQEWSLKDSDSEELGFGENPQKSVNLDRDDEGPTMELISELNNKIKKQFNPAHSKRKQTMYGWNENSLMPQNGKTAHGRFYSTMVSKRASIMREGSQYFAPGKTIKDLVYVCTKNVKFLKIFRTTSSGIELHSSQNFGLYKFIRFDQIKKVDLSEKDSFLMVLHFREEDPKTGDSDMKQLILELPLRARLLRILKGQNLQHCILAHKSLRIEGDDPFKNSCLNLFPKAVKQGFLELFVNDFFNDWKTFCVCLVDKTLFLIPANRKSVYKDYKSTLRKVKIYRLVSVNVINKTHKIGLNRSFTFCVKLNHENTQLVFSAYNKRERKEWLAVL